MRFAKIFFIIFTIVLCFHQGTALRCRTDDQQMNDQFEKVMQRCRSRLLHNNLNNNDDGNSSEDDSDEDDSYDDQKSNADEKNSNNKFNNGRFGTTETSHMKNSGSDNNRAQKSNSRRYEQNFGSTDRPYPYNRMNNNSYGNNMASNDRFSQNMTLRNGGYNRMANSGYNNNYGQQTYQDDQACAIHCFFEELNLTDQRGFPERFSVAKIMRQNIRDPQLKNFIEEAVMTCFYSLETDRNKEPCRFSQSLLSCLANKGKEKCEDWEIQ